MKPRPLHDRICIEPIDNDNLSGFIIPKSCQKRATRGLVVAVGAGREDENGDFVPFDDINVGDVVCWESYADEHNWYERSEYRRKYVFLRKSELLAVIG